MPRLIISKNTLPVAKTSNAALCASSKEALNNFVYNSVKVGHLNLPPRPPGIAQYSVVSSFFVSINGLAANIFSKPQRNNSEPIILLSNSIL